MLPTFLGYVSKRNDNQPFPSLVPPHPLVSYWPGITTQKHKFLEDITLHLCHLQK